MLQTRQPLGLEAEPPNRGLPITGSQSPGPNQTKQNKTVEPMFKKHLLYQKERLRKIVQENYKKVDVYRVKYPYIHNVKVNILYVKMLLLKKKLPLRKNLFPLIFFSLFESFIEC